MPHNTTNRKAPAPTKVQGAFQNSTEPDCPTASPECKAIGMQIQQLALAGHVVHKGQSGDFLVCKYGMSRYCQDFAELQAFARQLGVNHE
jgi:hypothetical protein